MATEAILSLQTPAPSELRRRYTNYFATGLIGLAAVCGVAALLFILGYVILRGFPALNVAFFVERPLPFGEEGGGVGPAIMGTLMMLLVAAAIGIPVGVGTAIYLSEIGRGSFAQFVRFIIDMMAGLPSIVIGVFVWAILVRTVFNQFSGLAGGVSLAIIMVPIVTRTVEEILRLVPGNLREASLALGVPQWRTILGVVLPTARVGVVTGVVLSLARAGGETAPLIMTALGNQFFNFDLREPMAALPVQIYTFAKSPYDDWHTKAWGSALVLVIVIGCLSLAARTAVRRKA
ncbi:MAG: phosphate ABC transporter permease PstA [Chloroflexota bacterium]